MQELGSHWIGNASTDFDRSFMGVPLLVGGSRHRSRQPAERERENAFSEVDVRLLQTLASSMGIALENARLFDETQRLLKVSEQRAAELSAINTVSQALVAESDLDRMIQLIGEQLLDIFNAGHRLCGAA